MTAAEEIKTEEKIDFFTLNVGHGDSHVIHFKENKAAVIIDPGNSELILQLLHNQLKIKHIPLILISHGDMDHMGGLNDVIIKCLEDCRGEPVKVGHIFFNDEGMAKIKDKARIKKFFEKFRNLAVKHNLKYKYIIANDNSSEILADIFAKYGIECKMYYPEHVNLLDVHLKNDYNLGSVLFYLVFAKQKILYTGDLPYAGWKQVKPGEDLTSDVFKVPHHGGKISNSPGKDTRKILERVNPNFALISVGDKYNHPLPEVVEAIVTHNTSPHLFCTQMTRQCCPDEKMKAKIEDFYEKHIKKRSEKKILKLGSSRGTLCAGTIRVTFDNKTDTLYTSPLVFTHHKMLKTLFNTDRLLCSTRF